MKKLFICILLGCAVMGCGGMINDTQVLSFSTNVDPAKVTLSTGITCTTPCQLVADTGQKGLMMTVEKQGYSRITNIYGRKVSFGAIALDIIGGLFWVGPGLTSTSSDIYTGHIYEYAPEAYYANMVKDEENTPVFRESTAEIFFVQNNVVLRTEAAQGGGTYTGALASMIGISSDELIKMIKDNTDDTMLLAIIRAVNEQNQK